MATQTEQGRIPVFVQEGLQNPKKKGRGYPLRGAFRHLARWETAEMKTLDELWRRNARKQEIQAALPARSWEAICRKVDRLHLRHTWYSHPISLKPQEASYLAGIVDGEGSICQRARGGHWYSLRMSITNTDLCLIQWVQERIPGQVYPGGRSPLSKRPCYRWDIMDLATIYALAQILRPYLIVKKCQATVAMTLAYRRLQHPRQPWGPEDLQLIQRLHELNRSLDLPQAEQEALRQHRTVLSVGGWDPPHQGHIAHLEAASLLGDRLIVGINSDSDMIRKKNYCLLPWETRKAIISNLRFVDQVLPLSDGDGTCAQTLAKVKPDIFAKGGDRDGPHNMPQSELDICEKLGIKIIYGVGGGKVQSSSELVRAAREKAKAP